MSFVDGLVDVAGVVFLTIIGVGLLMAAYVWVADR